MSSEKTAEMFKNKSEEEIMNWMIRYMSPEQIKSCFDGELPEEEKTQEELQGGKQLDVEDIRKFCANKRYVIHKIEGSGEDAKVYFWYYLIKNKQWLYSIEPLQNFPQTMGESADECGPDTNISNDFRDELIESYNIDSISPSTKFNSTMGGEDQVKIFNKVKKEYEKDKINEDWKDTLLAALNIQKEIVVPSTKKQIINFSPVLIESVSTTKVNYYYLINDGDSLKFVEANLSLNEFREDLIEIIDDFKLEIETPGEPSGSSAKTVDEWKQEIREAANDIVLSDLERIKEIYTKFPLSNDSTYFMKNLFSGNEFGNNFGRSGISSNVQLTDYVKMKYGNNTANMYDAKVLSNNFGTQTIALVAK